jgi:hypothetical protein
MKAKVHGRWVMRRIGLALSVVFLNALLASAIEPPPPVNRWAEGDHGAGGGGPADVVYGRQFSTVNIAPSAEYIRYLFEPKQAVILAEGGDYWLFFAYNDALSNVETVVFKESALYDPGQWMINDVHTWTGSGDLRYVSPAAYYDGMLWYPEITFNAYSPTTTWHMYDQDGVGAGNWTPVMDVAGPTYDYYLPLTEIGCGNLVFMDGQARDVANDTHVFKAFNGFTGTIQDPPGEMVVFPDNVVWGQGYENSQLLLMEPRLVIAAGGYRSDQYTLPTNPLLVVFNESTDGGFTWTDTVWVDQSFLPDIPGEYPGIAGHYSNSFFDGLIDMDGDLHFLCVVVDYGCYNNTSYVHGMYDIHEEYGVWAATQVCDGTYQVTPDSIWDPRTEILGGDTQMHSPSLAQGEDGTLFAAWADYGFYDGVTATFDIWITRSHDGGATWLPAVKTTETDADNEYFPRLVPTATDSFVYVLTMYNSATGPLDMIQVPVDFQVVPVELAGLTAQPVDGGVLVSWQTRTEQDNLGFNVERAGSRNGSYHRVNAELVRGAGTTGVPQSYEYLDETVEAGRSYWYRLEDVSLTGERTLHGPVQVMVPGASGLALQVLGGAEPSFRMQFTSAGEAELAVYDVRGSRVAVVWQGVVSAEETRTARMSANIGSGLYTAKLTQGNRSVTQRVVIHQ